MGRISEAVRICRSRPRLVSRQDLFHHGTNNIFSGVHGDSTSAVEGPIGGGSSVNLAHIWSARSSINAHHDRSRTPRRGWLWPDGRPRPEERSLKVPLAAELPTDIQAAANDFRLESWCIEVLRRVSLWQRQTVLREIGTMRGVRNPSGVIMSRVRAVASPEELVAIFIDLNGLDRAVEAKLWGLSPDQRAAVLAPGIYVQNVRNTSVAVRSRIARVVEGKNAMSRSHRREGRERSSTSKLKRERAERQSPSVIPHKSRRRR